jgi:ribosomal protein L10
MASTKQQKAEYVAMLQKELGTARTVAIMPLDGMPDRLLQKVRNALKPGSRIVIARKKLVERAMGERLLPKLEGGMNRNFAVVTSDKEPFELYKSLNSNRLRLMAKPNQIAPQEIVIEPGDTSVAPGQTVTELKNAGIDVQIKQGKVVIAKRKVLVERGSKISKAIANALKILEVTPFEVVPKLSVAFSSELVYNEAALMIDSDYVSSELAKSFNEADTLSTSIGMVTQYNVSRLVVRAYRSAMAVGVEGKILEPEIISILMADAASAASSVAKQAGVDA